MNEDRFALRMLVRLREDYQGMRKALDNRIGRKADGSAQNVEERVMRPEDVAIFTRVSNNARLQEEELVADFESMLRRFPIYTNYLEKIKGIGPVAAAWLIGEIDINRATTVSKIWQFAGLNPGLVRGKKRVETPDGPVVEVTDTLIRGDKLTPGFVAPFNKRLRTALVGVMAANFLKAQSPYALDFYYPYKARLEQETNTVGDVAWKDASNKHRDLAARRYMVKMFLLDLYTTWRTMEGLPVRPPYQEQYLGHARSA